MEGVVGNSAEKKPDKHYLNYMIKVKINSNK